jgi:YHS domain-containing protein
MIKKRNNALIAGFCTLLFAGICVAGDNATDTTKKATEPKQQTVCPVMGGIIDSSEYTDIQGQRVYHCCAGCQKKLVADPDKYFKKSAEQGVIYENIQKRCPVTGKTLTTKEFFTEYDGRRIYFSDKECAGTFAADPQKYLKILDVQTKEEHPKKPAAKSGHEGHNH